jgi:hypothetical protein
VKNTPNFQSIAPYGIKSAVGNLYIIVESVTPNFKGYA